jgi:fatty-acyl-CoA synthase
VALINSNLESKSLAHCISVAGASKVIVGAELAAAFMTVEGQIGEAQPWATGGPVAGCEDLDAGLAAVADTRPDRSVRNGMTAASLCLYVYTSGTTGLPKAGKLTHMRTQGMMRAFIAATFTNAADRVYICLPLYHGTGGLCGVGIALMTGATIILRRKFSATAFWDDVVDHGATVFVYIGELCRYLLNQPTHSKENKHRLKSCFGNGLRPDVWERFVPRFKLKRIAEFYGSTEGNVSFINYDDKLGTVGRIPDYFRKLMPARLVKFDVEREEVVRGPDGLCIEAGVDEAGEAVGPIGEGARERFDGYAGDEAQTQKKILRDVFAKGDMWFRTGDLMRRDAEGYFTFVDRIGDTFRWKSENVSTNEVAEALATFEGIREANVYGVAVPGADGRAGMASIVADDGLDLVALAAHLKRELPVYARPIFLRLQPEAEITGTFKYRKSDLVKDGFDPALVSDPLFWMNPAGAIYEPLDATAYERIQTGTVKF